MTPRITALSTPRPREAGLALAAGRKVADRMHAADDQARALGWEVTETRGWLGLRGRSYRDPRFNARRQDRQDPAIGREVRHV